MTITSTATFTVTDETSLKASTGATVLASLGDVFAGRGRLIHPTLGVYDYINTPSETVNVDADILAGPLWTHEMTLAGGVDAMWPGFANDVRVIERWIQGDTGSPIEHLRALWLFFANPPADPIATPVVWEPNYGTIIHYNVAMVAVRAGKEGYTLDRRLLSYGYAPSPVELEMRILGIAP